MNANELADELHDLDVQASQQSLNDWAEQASDMLRQQQAEIERLSNDNYKFIKAMANKDSHIESLKQLLNDSALRKASEK
jgi:ABC-type transporter Mla subunit MlaD